MTRDVAREIDRGRAAGARHRRQLKEVKEARRAARLAKRDAGGRWWRRRVVPLRGQSTLTVAPAPRPEDVTRTLDVLLDGIAQRIAERGTATELVALHAVHDATRWSAPGASAALVDWEGSETARLRAFGVLHGVVLGVLGPEDRAWLLERLRGGTAHELRDRIA